MLSQQLFFFVQVLFCEQDSGVRWTYDSIICDRQVHTMGSDIRRIISSQFLIN